MKFDDFDFVRAVLSLFKAAPNLSDEKFPAYTLDNERNLAKGFSSRSGRFKFVRARMYNASATDEKIIVCARQTQIDHYPRN